MLFGCDFFLARKASEINFWQDIVGKFQNSFDEVIIVSVNNRPIAQEQMAQGITLYNITPYYWGNKRNWSDPEYTGKRFHKLPLSIVYKTVTFIKYLQLFDELIEKHRIDVIHYMRVFGLLNKLLTSQHPDLLFTMTVPTHVDRGFPFHYPYHAAKKMGFQGMDKLIATSQATRERLLTLGVGPEKIEVIPWSSCLRSTAQGTPEENMLRQRLGIRNDAAIVLWSGPLQDTGEKEFRYSLEIANSIAKRCDLYHFVFAFKPDALKTAYLRLAAGIPAVTVVETAPSIFDELRRQAILFLSPICNRNRTVAPPLTWIEMMQRRVPVLTTTVHGVDELIENGRSGFLVNGVAETADLLVKLKASDFRRAGECAKRIVESRYDLDDIARMYLEMWVRVREKKVASGGKGKQSD